MNYVLSKSLGKNTVTTHYQTIMRTSGQKLPQNMLLKRKAGGRLPVYPLAI